MSGLYRHYYSYHSKARISSARFGGEEFAVLLSNTTLNEAKVLTELIGKEFEESPFVYGDDSLNVTVSIGISCLTPKPEQKPNLLIEQADSALYRA